MRLSEAVNPHRMRFAEPAHVGDPSAAVLEHGPLLLLSPHRDDAALSCEAVLGREEPVTVLTVFAGRPEPVVEGAWDARCGFSSSEESWPARAAEEEAAIGGSGHRLETGPLLEAQHLDGARPDSDAHWIVDRVRRWLAEWPDGLVLAPVGAGWRRRTLRHPRRHGPRPHADHVLLGRCAAGACMAGGGRLALYDEYPYSLGGDARRRARTVARHMGRQCHELTVVVDRDAKAGRIANYVSQLPHLLASGRPDDPTVLPRTERYWYLPPGPVA